MVEPLGESANSAHLPVEGWGLHHYDEAARRSRYSIAGVTFLCNDRGYPVR